jgi:hypothetical protein
MYDLLLTIDYQFYRHRNTNYFKTKHNNISRFGYEINGDSNKSSLHSEK